MYEVMNEAQFALFDIFVIGPRYFDIYMQNPQLSGTRDSQKIQEILLPQSGIASLGYYTLCYQFVVRLPKVRSPRTKMNHQEIQISRNQCCRAVATLFFLLKTGASSKFINFSITQYINLVKEQEPRHFVFPEP
jgi:hypothetical protein